MNILKRYDNFFVRKLVRIEFKTHMRENVIKNLIPLLNDDDDYLFYNTFLSLFVARNKRRVIK